MPFRVSEVNWTDDAQPAMVATGDLPGRLWKWPTATGRLYQDALHTRRGVPMPILSVKGFIDTHVHTGPAPFRRLGDTIDVARWCWQAGMAGIVVKSHFEATITKVYHARKEIPDFPVFAGIALNRGVGGINPGAVEQALQQEARFVWMPTIDAANHARIFGATGAFGTIGSGSYSSQSARGSRGLYTVLNGNQLTADVKEVIDLIADFNAVLATGHLSREEILAVVDYALSKNHNKIVVTHPEMQCPNLDLRTQVELAQQNCLMEYCAVNCMPMFQSVSSDQMKEAIDAVGADRAIIATDSGQPFSPKTPDMFRMFAQILYEKGVSLADIATMAIRNPACLLDIRPLHDSVQLMDELFGVAREPTLM